MKVKLDRSRLYLVCLYFSMSFLYLSFVLGEEDPIPLLGYILALIIFIVLSHDRLLQVISEALGQRSGKVAQDSSEDPDLMHTMRQMGGNLAHELRTPLSAIRASMEGCEAYLPQLMEGYEYSAEMFPERFPPIREDHRNSLVATPARVQLMVDQANNVMDMLLTNLGGQVVDTDNLETVDARRLVERAVERYPFRSGERRRVQLQLRDNFRFLGVENLCLHVLFNLLKNSLHATTAARKGDIRILLERGESHNCIVFRDSGPGIEDAVRDRLFDAFFTTRTDGLGLGLNFSKRVIEAMGGTIACAAQAGEFTEFRLSFPFLASD